MIPHRNSVLVLLSPSEATGRLATMIGSQEDMLLVATQAGTATEAMKEFRLHRPDVTLMDLRLPGANGRDALIAIRGEWPQARVVVLTTSDGDAEIQRALRAGAAAYVLKSSPQEELLTVIRSVHAGKRYVPAEVATRLAEHLGDDELTVTSVSNGRSQIVLMRGFDRSTRLFDWFRR